MKEKMLLSAVFCVIGPIVLMMDQLYALVLCCLCAISHWLLHLLCFYNDVFTLITQKNVFHLEIKKNNKKLIIWDIWIKFKELKQKNTPSHPCE